MRNIFLTFMFTILGLNCYAQNNSIVENRYELKGKLIKDIGEVIQCGRGYFGYVLEFEILEFSYPDYKEKNVAVIVPCPRENFFAVGQTYLMKLEKESQTEARCTVYDDSAFEKYPIEKLQVLSLVRL